MKPGVYVNKIEKKLNNNERVYFSNGDIGDRKEKNKEDIKESKIETLQENLSVNKQIQKIFESSSYIYKADVEIVMEDKIVTKRLIGKNGKYLITIDNELIPIDKIKEIKNKNE